MAFKQVMGLWVTPDFSECQAGRSPAPRVNHSKVDFERLQRVLAEEFRYGPAVKLQVANDTIDQVTMHARMAVDPMDVQFRDFGEQMIKAAKKHQGAVVDVRSAWSRLHVLADRDFAPPPIGIPILITAEDFEDAQVWSAQMRPVVGMRPFNPFEPAHPSDHDSGRLSKKLKTALESIFGVAFEEDALLSKLASDKLPGWVDAGLEEMGKRPEAAARSSKASTPDEGVAKATLSDALKAVAEISRLERLAEGKEDDGTLFNCSEEDLLAGMSDFIEMATGKRVDAGDFFDQMRLAGGVHGPSAPAWFDLLSSLGWQLDGWQEDATRFQPAFLSFGRRSGARIPVVCENYNYTPGDDGDDLVKQAKTALASLYPDGVMLVFKTVHSMEYKDKVYSCGGLYYTRRQWKPFAICYSMADLDSLLEQFEGGFSFNSPSPKYADEGYAIARGLNLMTHGRNPNDYDQKLMRLHSGMWFSVLPADL